LDGLKGPVTVEGKSFGASVMPAFGPHQFNWSPEKISQVLTYVRQEWGNKAGPITAAQVEAVAAQIGDHTEWTSDELTAIK
jgi:mono/diheme cytochrome c family protein